LNFRKITSRFADNITRRLSKKRQGLEQGTISATGYWLLATSKRELNDITDMTLIKAVFASSQWLIT
jgi:hypothetical protein